MRILFNNGTPNPIARSLTEHEVAFARQIDWHEFQNGRLQDAENAVYEVLLTSGKNMRYQQNLSGRSIAIIVLGNQQWPDGKRHLDRIVAAINAVQQTEFGARPLPR
jgi:hypothetical protein